jgi:hypothetical protein
MFRQQDERFGPFLEDVSVPAFREPIADQGTARIEESAQYDTVPRMAAAINLKRFPPG